MKQIVDNYLKIKFEEMTSFEKKLVKELENINYFYKDSMVDWYDRYAYDKNYFKILLKVKNNKMRYAIYNKNDSCFYSSGELIPYNLLREEKLKRIIKEYGK